MVGQSVERAYEVVQRMADGGYGDDPVITRALADSALCGLKTLNAPPCRF
jgi:hypothetical protein